MKINEIIVEMSDYEYFRFYADFAEFISVVIDFSDSGI